MVPATASTAARPNACAAASCPSKRPSICTALRQAEAHRRLELFLADCQAAGKRCVLVVTGKGATRAEAGVLRSALPHWLNQPPNRARVLSFDYAQQKHGGTGAVYILLRRKR